jgi:L-fucose mutarotase/ribose pyranase (RbsD/FucU family)
VNPTRDRECESWKSRFEGLLPVFGHRNWIVVADAAYPAQSNPGIETLYTGANHMELLEEVLTAIDASRHVRPIIYLDAELKLVTDDDSPGVNALRDRMAQFLAGKKTREVAHEQIIARLDEAAKVFRILILKSTLAIPYTSIFLELDCGYWSEEAEKRLRAVHSNTTS